MTCHTPYYKDDNFFHNNVLYVICNFNTISFFFYGNYLIIKVTAKRRLQNNFKNL